jgi:serine/threonine protein kinase
MFVNSTEGNVGVVYDVIEVIGEGAFGIVSRAVDKSLGIPVAIKTIYRSMISDAASETMLSEYEMLKNLQHPNIMKTYDLIYDHKKFNLVTELFEGGDLFEKLEIQGTIPEDRAKAYLS